MYYTNAMTTVDKLWHEEADVCSKLKCQFVW